MFSAQLVAGPTYLVIAALVGVVVLVVGEANRIENQMVVNILLGNMGGEYKLVLAAHYFFCEPHPDSVAIFGGYLPRSRSISIYHDPVWVSANPLCLEWAIICSSEVISPLLSGRVG